MGKKAKQERLMLKWLSNRIYRLIWLFSRVLGALPLTWGQLAGRCLGQAFYVLDRRHRMIAVNNISMALGRAPGSPETRRLARKVFGNIGQVLFETCWSLHCEERALTGRFRINGFSNLARAHESGKGVLALTAHFGNWEVLSVVGGMIPFPISIVYRPLDFEPLERFVLDYRTRYGATPIPKKKAFRAIYRRLKAGDVVSILMDQNVAWREGVFADFFDRLACTNSGMALLAMKSGAPVVPIFLIREGDRFTAEFLPEVPTVRTGDKIKDLEENTRRFNQVIETMVRRHPDQWFWVHRRWNTRPWCEWPRRQPKRQ